MLSNFDLAFDDCGDAGMSPRMMTILRMAGVRYGTRAYTSELLRCAENWFSQ
jgi:hypothetical protein